VHVASPATLTLLATANRQLYLLQLLLSLMQAAQAVVTAAPPALLSAASPQHHQSAAAAAVAAGVQLPLPVLEPTTHPVLLPASMRLDRTLLGFHRASSCLLQHLQEANQATSNQQEQQGPAHLELLKKPQLTVLRDWGYAAAGPYCLARGWQDAAADIGVLRQQHQGPAMYFAQSAAAAAAAGCLQQNPTAIPGSCRCPHYLLVRLLVEVL
jgi:hypothetical protein